MQRKQSRKSFAKIKYKPSFRLAAAVFVLLSLSISVVLTAKMPPAGAWLTQTGDWQNLAGEYTIGIINYDVEIGAETLLEQDQAKNITKTYNLAVPITGAVKLYDDFADTKNPPTGEQLSNLRAAEFNQGVTVIHLRFVNKSDSPINISTQLFQTKNIGNNINFLPLPREITNKTYKTLDYYKYVMTTLKNPADLPAFTTAYNGYYGNADPKGFASDLGTIPGVTAVKPETGEYITGIDNKYYYIGNAYAIAWSEYGTGEYNVPDAAITKRESEFLVSVIVGQAE